MQVGLGIGVGFFLVFFLVYLLGLFFVCLAFVLGFFGSFVVVFCAFG